MRRQAALLVAVSLFAWTGISLGNSIFSFHSSGLGLVAPAGDARSLGMGYATVSVYDDDNITSRNPATLTAVNRASFTGTFVSQRRDVEDNIAANGTATYYEQNPRIIRLVVPVAYGIRVAAGLEPLTDQHLVWSALQSEAGIAFRDSLETNGGLWCGTLEAARAFGDFSAGVKMRVVRGDMTTEWRRTVASLEIDSTVYLNPLATSVLRSRHFSGLAFSLGATWRPDPEWTVGAVLDIKSSLDEQRIVSVGTRIPSFFYPSHYSDGASSVMVVSDMNDTADVSTSYPWGLGLGATWRPAERLVTTAEIYYQRWSQIHSSFDDSWRISTGIEFVPVESYRSLFFLRWPYRLGFRWEKHYIPSPNEGPTAWFVTAGFGIPLGKTRKTGRIDYAFEFGKRGTISANTAQERVWRHTISVTAWDEWFAYRPRR